DRQPRLRMEVAPHAFPDRHHFRIVGDGSNPDRLAHDHLLARLRDQNSGIPSTARAMNSRRTSPVGAMMAPAWASRNSRSMPVFLENAAPPHARIAAEVTLMAMSPAAALVSSTRNSVVSRGRSR